MNLISKKEPRNQTGDTNYNSDILTLTVVYYITAPEASLKLTFFGLNYEIKLSGTRKT